MYQNALASIIETIRVFKAESLLTFGQIRNVISGATVSTGYQIV